LFIGNVNWTLYKVLNSSIKFKSKIDQVSSKKIQS
jgi:hypothetical protein